MPGVSDEILRQIEADWHKEVDALQVLSLLALLVQKSTNIDTPTNTTFAQVDALLVLAQQQLLS